VYSFGRAAVLLLVEV